MHELSLAIDIVDIVENHARNAGAHDVCSVIVDVGELSGVVPDALELALMSAKENTMLQNARIQLSIISAMAKCRNCNATFKTSTVFDPCPFCNSFNPEIIDGNKLEVRSITIE